MSEKEETIISFEAFVEDLSSDEIGLNFVAVIRIEGFPNESIADTIGVLGKKLIWETMPPLPSNVERVDLNAPHSKELN